MKSHFLCATSFHYQSFESFKDAMKWFSNNFIKYKHSSENYAKLIAKARSAKRPFQFLGNLLGFFSNKNIIKTTPIVQDASASAYQIMSDFLLNETMAERTNLISNKDNKINYVSSFILEDLLKFLKVELDKDLSSLVCKYLTRKIVKSLFITSFPFRGQYTQELRTRIRSMSGLLRRSLVFYLISYFEKVCLAHP